MINTANRTLLGLGGALLLAWGVTEAQTTVRMEAEAMARDTYRIEALDFASNGALINLKGDGFVGTADEPFPGVSGEYDIFVVYHDENDGLAQLTVSINGREVDSWTLDERVKGGEQPIEANRFTREIATGYTVATGDWIRIIGLQGNWDNANVDYIEFVLRQAPPSGRIEAEDMRLDGYRVEALDFASGGALINLKGPAANGSATTQFSGTSGQYDITVVYHDENDGVAQLSVSIGGVSVYSWALDKRIPRGEQPTETNRFSRQIASGYTVNSGDEIRIDGQQGDWDHANIDYIEFTRSVPPVVDVKTEIQHLLSGDAGPFDDFGSSVAIDGNTAVIGASFESDGDTFNNGAAYVFTRSNGAWVEQAKLLASDKATNDRFGWSVALDGDTIVVGAPKEDDSGTSANGATYVFIRSNGVWVEQAKLLASDKSDGGRFGNNVAVQGDTAIIGTEWKDVFYVFTRSGGVWTEQANIPKGGSSVAIDGDTAIVGAPSEDDGDLLDSGAAYVFTYFGGEWVEQARLVASEKNINDRFGSSVAIDGDTAVIGSSASWGAIDRNGSAYVFVRSGGVWSEQARLLASDEVLSDGDSFGNSVAIDGDTAVIGAFTSGMGRRGAAYVFTRSGGGWKQQFKLLPSDIASQQSNYGFGGCVSVDGRTAIVSGRATELVYNFSNVPGYVFSLDDDSQVQIDIAPFGEPDEPNIVRLPPPLQRVDVLVLSTNIADGDSVDFDATQVDPATTRFGPDEATAILRYVGVIDGDNDGDQDLFLKFNTYWTGIRCGDTEATLTGKTYAGESFAATDSVSPYPCP